MKKTLKTFLLLIFVLVLLFEYHSVFSFKYGDGMYSIEAFYAQEENSVDLLVLGSSHAFEDVNTGTMWKNYGMAAYDLCGSIQPMWNAYYYLREALKTQTPKLVVLEAYTITRDDEYSDESRIIKNSNLG